MGFLRGFLNTTEEISPRDGIKSACCVSNSERERERKAPGRAVRPLEKKESFPKYEIESRKTVVDTRCSVDGTRFMGGCWNENKTRAQATDRGGGREEWKREKAHRPQRMPHIASHRHGAKFSSATPARNGRHGNAREKKKETPGTTSFRFGVDDRVCVCIVSTGVRITWRDSLERFF